MLFAVITVNAQTSEFRRNFSTTSGAPLSGYTNYIFLVPQANTYPTGALALTEDGTRDGVYYRANVPDGEYKIYIDVDKAGAGTPSLYIENYWIGEKRLSTIADHFDAADSYKLKETGIKDNAITTSKIANDAVVTSKIPNSAITSDKINSSSVTTIKIDDNAITTNKIATDGVQTTDIKDGNITVPKLSQSVIDLINVSGGGSITNNPDDVTLETKTGSVIGIKSGGVTSPYIARNISEQKNFNGTIPIKVSSPNGDSSLWIGGSISGSSVGLRKFMKPTEYPYYYSSIVSPPDTSESPSWAVTHTSLDWDPAHLGRELAYHILYTDLGANNKSSMSFGMEPNYEVPNVDPDLSMNIYEWWYEYKWPSVSYPQYSTRPFQVACYVPYNTTATNIRSSVNLVAETIWFGSHFTTPSYLIWSFDADNYLNNFLSITDTFKISYEINNIGWLKQRSTDGNPIDLMYLDNSNSTRISSSGQSTVFGNRTYDYALLSSTSQRFESSIYLTKADYNYSMHADTCLSLKVTSPGYGIISSKYLYNVADEYHWSNASYTDKMVFQYSSGALTVGGTPTVGSGAVYAGSYYTGSTAGYLSSALGTLTASGLFVAESSGGSPTRQLYYRTVTVNGVTIQVLTTDVP